VDDTVPAQSPRRWTRGLLRVSPFMVMGALDVLSDLSNASPSETVIRYAPVVWIPLGLGVILFMTDRAHFSKMPLWQKILAIPVALLFLLFLARCNVLYGPPALFNSIAGEPFEVRTRVVKKFWGKAGPSIKVVDYPTASGFLRVDESLYRKVRVRRVVILRGVQTALGRTVHTVLRP
jgi:hypothetical protein